MRLKDHELEIATLRDVIRERRSLGDRPFAIVDGVTLTFEQADDRANRVANSLARLGVTKGDVVNTYMYNSVDHICAWLACAKLGAIWAPINIALVNLDLTYTIQDAEPAAIVLDVELLDNYAAVRERVGGEKIVTVVRGERSPAADWTLAWADLLAGAPEEPEVEILPEDPAGILYTGGSTGLPKGVVVSNLSYFPPVLRYREMFAPGEGDVHLGVGQMCHAIGSAIDVFCPLYWGLTTVIPRWFSASGFWDLARRHDATILGCIIGPLVSTLLNQPPRPDDRDHRLRVASSGTAQIPADRVAAFTERFGVQLLEIYGQSETGALGAVGQRLDDRPYRSQGRPHGWCEVMIADERDQPCPPGVQGEILMRPTFPHTFLLGYRNKPDKYAEACRNFWFHTGDLGHLDDQGYLHFYGRMAHYIRRRGENIAAVEVEHTILAHPAVTECAAVGVPAELGDEDLKVYLQLEAGVELDPAEVVAFCAERLAYFKVPRYVEFVTEMPRSTAKNEIERHKLKGLGVGQAWDRERAGITVGKRR